MAHGEIAGVEPAAFEGRLACPRVFEITHHDRISGEEYLAHGLAIARCLHHRLRIGHHHALKRDVIHALARIYPRPLFHRQGFPEAPIRKYRPKPVQKVQIMLAKQEYKLYIYLNNIFFFHKFRQAILK